MVHAQWWFSWKGKCVIGGILILLFVVCLVHLYLQCQHQSTKSNSSPVCIKTLHNAPTSVTSKEKEEEQEIDSKDNTCAQPIKPRSDTDNTSLQTSLLPHRGFRHSCLLSRDGGVRRYAVCLSMQYSTQDRSMRIHSNGRDTLDWVQWLLQYLRLPASNVVVFHDDMYPMEWPHGIQVYRDCSTSSIRSVLQALSKQMLRDHQYGYVSECVILCIGRTTTQEEDAEQHLVTSDGCMSSDDWSTWFHSLPSSNRTFVLMDGCGPVEEEQLQDLESFSMGLPYCWSKSRSKWTNRHPSGPTNTEHTPLRATVSCLSLCYPQYRSLHPCLLTSQFLHFLFSDEYYPVHGTNQELYEAFMRFLSNQYPPGVFHLSWWTSSPRIGSTRFFQS